MARKKARNLVDGDELFDVGTVSGVQVWKDGQGRERCTVSTWGGGQFTTGADTRFRYEPAKEES